MLTLPHLFQSFSSQQTAWNGFHFSCICSCFKVWGLYKDTTRTASTKSWRFIKQLFKLTLSPNFLWQEGHCWNSSSAFRIFFFGVAIFEGGGTYPSTRFFDKSKTLRFMVLTFWHTLICLSKAFSIKVRPQLEQGSKEPVSKAFSEGDMTFSEFAKAGRTISSLENKENWN